LDELTDAPTEDEFELSIFGAGVGEALAIHVGGGQWGFVDSFRDPVSSEPVGLRYMKDLGVSTQDVGFILATHWHDDHIDGLAEMVEEFPEAMFGCSSAYTGKDFTAVTLEYPPDFKTSGVQEMRRCFELVESGAKPGSPRPTPKRILEHQNVWWSPDDAVVVHALAPTSGALSRAEQDIINHLLPDAQRRRSLGRLKPNQASIVLNVWMPEDSVLLGGDLEERGSAGTGWSGVVARFPSSYPRSSVFKVPHHGSAGAHFDGQWTTLLYEEPAPFAAVTSFASSDLPRDGDLRRLLHLAQAVYQCGVTPTQPLELTGPERRRLAVDGIELEAARGVGQVRLRKKLGSSETWQITLAGDARQITEADLSSPKRAPRRRGKRRRR